MALVGKTPSPPQTPPAPPGGAPVAEADWQLIRSFVAVMRAGNLTAAARRLGASQPTLGRHIRDLEALSGEVLFVRQGTKLIPTERAQTLFQWAETLEQDMTALSRAFAARMLEVPGLVRITTTHLFAEHVVPFLLGEVMAAHPGLEIEILANDSLENLLRRDADIAVRFARPGQDALLARRIGDVEIGLYAARSYLERHGRPRTIDELAGHSITSSLSGGEVRSFVAQMGRQGTEMRLRLRSNTVQAQEAAVRAGLGIGAVHLWRAVHFPELERVMPELPIPALPLWLVAHDDLNRSRRIRLVFDALQAGLAARFGRRAAGG
jgi:DNA-binding transcriptional LysR family regulator